MPRPRASVGRPCFACRTGHAEKSVFCDRLNRSIESIPALNPFPGPPLPQQSLRAAILALPFLFVATHASSLDRANQLTLAGISAYNNGDFATAYRDLKSAADAGDSDAEVNLGYMYARGQVVPMNQATALALYRRSAAQGNGEGMNAIAYKYMTGSGVPVDFDAALEWFCRAIEKGDPRAMNNLASLHAQGIGVPYDIEEARNLWRQAAELGHSNAMFNLGDSLFENTTNPSARREGMQWIIRAAELGMPAAITWLRANNYAGALPAPVDTSGMMTLALKGAHGEAKLCLTS